MTLAVGRTVNSNAHTTEKWFYLISSLKILVLGTCWIGLDEMLLMPSLKIYWFAKLLPIISVWVGR